MRLSGELRLTNTLALTCVRLQTQLPSHAPVAAALQSHVSSRLHQRQLFPFLQSPASCPPPLLQARLPGSYDRPPGVVKRISKKRSGEVIRMITQ